MCALLSAVLVFSLQIFSCSVLHYIMSVVNERISYLFTYSGDGGYSGSPGHFSDKQKDSRQQVRENCDYVPTRDVPTTDARSHSVIQIPVYHVSRTGQAPDQLRNGHKSLPPARDDSGNGRYPSFDEDRPVLRQEPKDQCRQTEAGSRSRSSSASRRQAPELRPSSASVQSRQNTTRDISGTADQLATSGPESQPPSRTSVDHRRADIRRANDRSSSVHAKSPQSSVSSGRPSSRGRSPANQDQALYVQDQAHQDQDSGHPCKVSSGYRSSEYQDGRKSTGNVDNQAVNDCEHRRSSLSRNKAKSPVSERRRETKVKHVKFQSDPDLSHKDDNYDSFRSSRPSSDARPTAVSSNRDQRFSHRRYQSSESLGDSNCSRSSRDQENRDSERRHASQTSLDAPGRSSVTTNQRAVQRASSVDRVDSRRNSSRTRDSSSSRGRILPRVPIKKLLPGDDYIVLMTIEVVTSANKVIVTLFVCLQDYTNIQPIVTRFGGKVAQGTLKAH